MYGPGHTVLHIVFYILRLTGSDSGFAGRMRYADGFFTIGDLGRPSLRALGPRPVRRLSGIGSTTGNESQRPVQRITYHASGASPPTSSIIIASQFER